MQVALRRTGPGGVYVAKSERQFDDQGNALLLPAGLLVVSSWRHRQPASRRLAQPAGHGSRPPACVLLLLRLTCRPLALARRCRRPLACRATWAL